MGNLEEAAGVGWVEYPWVGLAGCLCCRARKSAVVSGDSGLVASAVLRSNCREYLLLDDVWDNDCLGAAGRGEAVDGAYCISSPPKDS